MSQKAYEQNLVPVKEFCTNENIPLVCVESNFGMFFDGWNFNSCGFLRTMSTALSMQKLFQRYYYASGTTNQQFAYDDSMGHYASLLAPLISTECTDIMVADQDVTRPEKTAFIANNPLTQRYLTVCWKYVKASNRGETEYLKYPFVNCTRCTKCKRTILTLDLLGNVEKYRGLFDVDYYYSVKDEMIKEIVDGKDSNVQKRMIYDLMIEKGWRIPSQSHTSQIKSLLSKLKCKIKKII